MSVSIACHDCGMAAAKATFGTAWCNPNATWYEEVCQCCGETKPCTEARDFRHPNFALVKKAKAH